MDITCAYSALQTALTYGTELGWVVFLKILIELLRPDIVDRKNRVKPICAQSMSSDFDFIIIGAGSAGSVLANRLTENANSTVLLLEAGGDEPVIADVPLIASVLQRTEIDWEFKTEPSSNYCLGMNNNQCRWPIAKVLGGCSTHNAMLYARGNRRDYDHWRDLGNPGWGYSDVLPYFKKSEDIRIPELRNSPYHGTGGYLTVERLRYTFPLTKHILDAGRDIGYDVIDVHGESQVGFMPSQSTVRNGLRCSAAKAFLRSASHRKNLHVSTHSMVDKILVDESTKTAYGVQFRHDGETYTVYARTEVILSAGVVKSPQILMLSGIGPKEHLEEIGIPVIHDSPGVGENLQDHVTLGGFAYIIDEPSESPKPTDNKPDTEGSSMVNMSGVNEFLYKKSGSLYDSPGGEAMAFVNTMYAQSDPEYPDIQLVLSASGENADGGFSSKWNIGIRDELFEGLYGNIVQNKTYSLSATLMRPKSRGYIKLRDADPDHHPRIVPNYFDDPHDLDVLIEGAKISYNISQTKTMQMFNARLNPNSIPDCAHLTFFSDDYLRCHARHYSLTAYHPVGTCKMGPANDSMAVVDPRLRVYGVKALRVVDASIMPNVISANTNAPTIMIGEKAADLIKEDHHLGRTEVRIKPGTCTCTKRKG